MIYTDSDLERFDDPADNLRRAIAMCRAARYAPDRADTVCDRAEELLTALELAGEHPPAHAPAPAVAWPWFARVAVADVRDALARHVDVNGRYRGDLAWMTARLLDAVDNAPASLAAPWWVATVAPVTRAARDAVRVALGDLAAGRPVDGEALLRAVAPACAAWEAATGRRSGAVVRVH
jgi:hypothetical protein